MPCLLKKGHPGACVYRFRRVYRPVLDAPVVPSMLDRVLRECRMEVEKASSTDIAWAPDDEFPTVTFT